MSKAVAVGTVGVAGCLGHSFDLEAFSEEYEGWEEDKTVVRVNKDDH